MAGGGRRRNGAGGNLGIYHRVQHIAYCFTYHKWASLKRNITIISYRIASHVASFIARPGDCWRRPTIHHRATAGGEAANGDSGRITALPGGYKRARSVVCPRRCSSLSFTLAFARNLCMLLHAACYALDRAARCDMCCDRVAGRWSVNGEGGGRGGGRASDRVSERL